MSMTEQRYKEINNLYQKIYFQCGITLIERKTKKSIYLGRFVQLLYPNEYKEYVGLHDKYEKDRLSV